MSYRLETSVMFKQRSLLTKDQFQEAPLEVLADYLLEKPDFAIGDAQSNQTPILRH